MGEELQAIIKGETAKAAAAFEQYAALGDDRSLTKLAEQRWAEAGAQGRKESAIHAIRNQLGIWSSKYKWQERIKLYDRALAEKKRKQREKELEALNDEQAKWAKAMTGLAMKQIQTLIEAKSFNAQAAVLLFKHATDLERIARGGNQELIKMEVSGDPDNPTSITHIENTQQILIYLPQKGEQEDIPRISQVVVEEEKE